MCVSTVFFLSFNVSIEFLKRIFDKAYQSHKRNNTANHLIIAHKPAINRKTINTILSENDTDKIENILRNWQFDRILSSQSRI